MSHLFLCLPTPLLLSVLSHLPQTHSRFSLRLRCSIFTIVILWPLSLGLANLNPRNWFRFSNRKMQNPQKTHKFRPCDLYQAPALRSSLNVFSPLTMVASVGDFKDWATHSTSLLANKIYFCSIRFPSSSGLDVSAANSCSFSSCSLCYFIHKYAPH